MLFGPRGGHFGGFDFRSLTHNDTTLNTTKSRAGQGRMRDQAGGREGGAVGRTGRMEGREGFVCSRQSARDCRRCRCMAAAVLLIDSSLDLACSCNVMWCGIARLYFSHPPRRTVKAILSFPVDHRDRRRWVIPPTLPHSGHVVRYVAPP